MRFARWRSSRSWSRAKAYTPRICVSRRFLFAAASVAAVFAILNRYFDRPAAPVPLVIDGKPNYNMGPVKFATVAAMFWGIAGFTVGLWAALELAFPAAQFRPAVAVVRPPAAAAHLRGDLRVRRQRADRDLVLRRAAHLPRAARRATSRRWFVVLGLQLLHRHRRHRLSARHHASRRNTPSPNGTPISGSRSSGSPISLVFLGTLVQAQRAAHLRGELVLSRLHPHHRGAAHRQQRRDPGVAVLAEVLLV